VGKHSDRAAIRSCVLKIYGSSRITGEGCANLQKEVVLIAVAIGPALDDLDGVVDALHNTCVQRMPVSGDDPVQVALQALSEGAQCGNVAWMGLLTPVLPGSDGR